MSTPTLSKLMNNDNTPKINLVAIIGCALAITTFGFNSIAGYARLEARMVLMEYQIGQLLSKAQSNGDTLRRLDNQPQR